VRGVLTTSAGKRSPTGFTPGRSLVASTMRKTLLFILTIACIPHFAFGAVLWTPQDTATSSSFYSRIGTDTTSAQKQSVYIDCLRLGWGQINSVYWWGNTTSNTSVIRVRANGKAGVLDQAHNTTPTVGSTTWSGGVYCGDNEHRFVELRFMYVSGSGVTAILSDAVTGSATDIRPGIWTDGLVSVASSVGLKYIPNLHIVGEYATSSGSTGGNSTTTYNFYTATTSPAESIDKFATVFMVFALCVVIALGYALAYHILIWKRKSSN